MRNKKKLMLLESKIFELEATIALMEIRLNDLMLGEGMELDANKWYNPIDNKR